ncbi:MAG: Gldg family protein [Promethearchaeota archaeon]
MVKKASIGLDYSHNNKLILEASSFADFTQFLFHSGYKLGKIQAGFDSLQKLETYKAILLSTPNNKKLTEQELDILEEYVRKGGSLLIVSSSGGDLLNRTNLNDLTRRFGFEFNPDEVNDSVNYVNIQKRPLLEKFKPHTITEQVSKVVFSSACSLNVLDFMFEDDENIKFDILIKAGLNCWRKVYNGKKWEEEDSPKIPLLVAIQYYEGKIVAFGCLSIFSSLGREYGFSAFDNDVLIANILRWLTTKGVTEGKVITVNLNLDLYYWANSVLEDQNWESVSDIINVSLKYFKDHYKEAIETIKKEREERLKARKRYEKEKEAELSAEDKILEMIPVRKKEDLEEIMSALEDITGEKIELSINLDEIEEEQEEIEKEDKKEDKESKEKTDGKIKDENMNIENLSENIGEKISSIEEEIKSNFTEAIEKAINDEESLIMDSARKEIEKTIEKELEAEDAEKLQEELKKKIGEDIEKEKQEIRAKAEKIFEEEKQKIMEKVKEEIEKTEDKESIDIDAIIDKIKKDLEEKREKILKKTREEMEQERQRRIKQIKERKMKIIKENTEFLEGILEAADIFSAPILDSDDTKENSEDSSNAED